MPSRRDLLTSAPAAGALLALGPAALPAQAQQVPPGPFWRSPSLVDETVIAANGAITTAIVAGVNERLLMTGRQVIEVAPDVWLLAGWGIAHSMAIRAPEGWIIIDTGDSDTAAKDMRASLEAATGGPVRVAAILLTHWHYAEGTGAWADEGTEVWGHEWLDRNRAASVGLSPLSGQFQARAAAQFGVFHPREGADAFPNNLGFTLDRIMAPSSYRAPDKLITNGAAQSFTVAGEQVTAMPNRTDATDSVGFHFPRHRLLITNNMAPGFIFNLSTLRGGPLRDPDSYLDDALHLETYDAALLLDIHAAPVQGEDAVRSAIRTSADRIRFIRDQSRRMIARGMDGRAAAEAVVMPEDLKGDYSAYGLIENQVRQIYTSTVSWFGNDIYDISPLAIAEEASRSVALMGGADAVRSAAAAAAAAGTVADWQWALRLTSLLLQIDPSDAGARAVRATAARALGQRTTSSNARGWYITEALDLEGALLAQGQPVTIAQVRAVLGTPRPDELVAAGTAGTLGFLPVLLDPALAGDIRLAFTLQVAGDPAPWQVELRNSVILAAPATAPLPDHQEITLDALADWLLGLAPAPAGSPLAALDPVLDRSGFAFLPGSALDALATPDAEEHLIGQSVL